MLLQKMTAPMTACKPCNGNARSPYIKARNARLCYDKGMKKRQSSGFYVSSQPEFEMLLNMQKRWSTCEAGRAREAQHKAPVELLSRARIAQAGKSLIRQHSSHHTTRKQGHSEC
jgi:hypothetical protein